MLSIVGIVAIVVMTIQAYKTAAGTERNAPLWAGLTAVIGIGIQFVLPVMIGIGFGIYLAASGTSTDDLGGGYYGLFTVIGLAGIVLSLVGMWLVIRHVSNVPDDDPAIASPPPPPPPTFGGNQ